MRNTIITLCILFMTGCAITSPQSCNLDNCQALGMSNAMSGGQLADNESVSRCNNEAPFAYRMGYEVGLDKFCTFERGLFGGEHGKAPVQSCSDSKWEEYQEGFLTGREIYATHQRLELITAQLELTRKQLWDVQSNRGTGTGTVAALDHERITVLRGAIANLASDRGLETRRLTSMRLNLKYSHNYKSNLSTQ